jgi:hypothetical protein
MPSYEHWMQPRPRPTNRECSWPAATVKQRRRRAWFRPQQRRRQRRLSQGGEHHIHTSWTLHFRPMAANKVGPVRNPHTHPAPLSSRGLALPARSGLPQGHRPLTTCRSSGGPHGGFPHGVRRRAFGARNGRGRRCLHVLASRGGSLKAGQRRGCAQGEPGRGPHGTPPAPRGLPHQPS